MYYVDYILDRVTMYRLVLYYLIALLVAAFVLSALHILPYSPVAVAVSTGVFVSICWITNKIFSFVFEAPVNSESVYITALILALIITPSSAVSSLPFFAWASIWAIASKFMFAVKRKHIFNPAAVAVLITSYFIYASPSWWVGNAVMAPFVLIGGVAIVRKIKREDMVFAFFVAALVTILGFTLVSGGDLLATLDRMMLHSSILFLAFVMLTEPLTSPPTKRLQVVYGVLVGILFAPQVHIGPVYSTPELALIVGNIFSYIVSPKDKLVLRLKEKIHIAPNAVDFLFTLPYKLSFTPGQYMEWTFPHKRADSRGNRRYFTIASSPTDDTLRLGVRFSEKGSSYKKALKEMSQREMMVGSYIAGDFVMPKDTSRHLVFIAGGIGITPFRSMLAYLLETQEKRPVTVLFSNKSVSEIVYTDILTQAQQQLGINVFYTLTDTASAPKDWTGFTGRFNEERIAHLVPDYSSAFFYISGPHTMVDGTKKTLKKLGVADNHIKTDFFPGLA